MLKLSDLSVSRSKHRLQHTTEHTAGDYEGMICVLSPGNLIQHDIAEAGMS